MPIARPRERSNHSEITRTNGTLFVPAAIVPIST
jgi:hypothetical protein